MRLLKVMLLTIWYNCLDPQRHVIARLSASKAPPPQSPGDGLNRLYRNTGKPPPRDPLLVIVILAIIAAYLLVYLIIAALF